jgi:signal transduction histidine kinase
LPATAPHPDNGDGLMASVLLQKLQSFTRKGGQKKHASILLPFLIISIGLGVLAYRSYELSVRMERGVNTLAVQYVGYAADITARRVDAAVASEFSRISEDWQQLERGSVTPTPSMLEGWMRRNDWIVAGIYLPDLDPEKAFYLDEKAQTSGVPRLTREFYTPSGTVRFTYDPQRLLASVRHVVRQQPLVHTPQMSEAFDLEHQSEVRVVVAARERGLVRTSDGFAYIAPLVAPLSLYAVRASVRTSYVGSAWENHRLISLAVSIVALALTALGGYIAMRGLKREAEAMKLRGALIANVSHELRTPLAMIRLAAETLNRTTKLKDKDRQDMQEMILREVLLLSHLVENVLDVARIQHRSTKALAFGPVVPRELVNSLVETYEPWIRSKGFTVDLQIEEAVEEQMWDRDAVSRALLNLIDNAIKYSADEKAISVLLRQDEQHVILEVRDRGIGIDVKDVQRIFDPYFRAKFSDTQTRRGAGLGLTLVQQIVGSHGGSIEVESRPGEGSAFRLLFPRGQVEPARNLSSLIEAPEAF